MADRFELCIVGREFANGYSELNIPEEQAERFEVSAAAKARGDVEAHPADQAYVRSLQYGLPPTAGIGIGIDRLIMLLAEVDAIRDVILFPMLRPEVRRLTGPAPARRTGRVTGRPIRVERVRSRPRARRTTTSGGME